jgi:mono/diheme cytochrome c family protein
MMKYFLGAVLVLSLCLTLPVLAVAGGDAETGKAIFGKKCASCHGKDGSGNPKMAKMLKVELAVNTESVAGMSDDDLTKLLTEGRGKKKPVKGLSDDDMKNVIAYVRTLKK